MNSDLTFYEEHIFVDSIGDLHIVADKPICDRDIPKRLLESARILHYQYGAGTRGNVDIFVGYSPEIDTNGICQPSGSEPEGCKSFTLTKETEKGIFLADTDDILNVNNEVSCFLMSGNLYDKFYKTLLEGNTQTPESLMMSVANQHGLFYAIIK